MTGPDRELRFRVSAEHDGERLDHLVAGAARVSRRVARTWIAGGRVMVGDKPTRILTRPLRAGAAVCVRAAAQDATAAPGPSRVPLRVLFVDRYTLVVDKPACLLSERDRFGSPAVESLAPGLLAEAGERGERRRVWLVHRLDAGTSGVLVLARTPAAAAVLGDAFRRGTVRKTYLALCRGRFAGERVVDAPIVRAERTRHAVSPKGKEARTRLVGLAATDEASLVAAYPETGRTHQIRVHLAHLGHPLLGDALYGGPGYLPGPPAEPIGRPMLHALAIVLPHPKTGAALRLSAPLPADFSSLVERLRLVEGLAKETS